MLARRRALAALIALGFAAAACAGGDDAASSPTEPPRGGAGQQGGFTTTTAEPELTGDPLVVVEQGLSTFPDPFEPTATLGGYGVVLENPNDEVMASGVRVVTRILDDAGEELLVHRVVLNSVMPGRRMAVGRTIIEPIEAPTQLDVKVEVSAWLRPADPSVTFTATDVVTEPEEAGGSVTRFRVHSTAAQPEDGVDVTALYRAADGRILGAESDSVSTRPGEAVDAQIRLLSPIPDLATTEVLVGRGFTAQTTG